MWTLTGIWRRAVLWLVILGVGFAAWRYESALADRYRSRAERLERAIREMEAETAALRYESETNATATEVERAMDLDLPVSPGLSGCSRPEPVPCRCPKIALLRSVPEVTVTVRPDGTLGANDTAIAVETCRQLRASERYYRGAIRKYNKRFATGSHK
jgi:hypothetical protein